MANSVKGEVALKLSDGREFTMCFDFDSRVAAEDEAGIPFHQIGERAQVGFQKFTRILIWAGLQKHQPEMSLHDVGVLLDEHGKDFVQAAERASKEAAPQEKESTSGNGGKAGKRAGRPVTKSSGRSGAKRD